MSWVQQHTRHPTGEEGGSWRVGHILHLPFMHCFLLKGTVETLGIIREDGTA